MASNGNSSSSSSGISFSGLLFIVFLVLKLTNIIDWSWWWITAPLWGWLAMVVVGVSWYFIYKGIKKLLHRRK
jgi:drug/metabolite transporter (DMT)-like permease